MLSCSRIIPQLLLLAAIATCIASAADPQEATARKLSFNSVEQNTKATAPVATPNPTGSQPAKQGQQNVKATKPQKPRVTQPVTRQQDGYAGQEVDEYSYLGSPPEDGFGKDTYGSDKEAYGSEDSNEGIESDSYENFYKSAKQPYEDAEDDDSADKPYKYAPHGPSRHGRYGDNQEGDAGAKHYRPRRPNRHAPYAGDDGGDDSQPRHGPEDDPYSAEESDEGYEQRPYEDSYSFDNRDFPTAQRADAVKQVYVGHGTFVWRELAAAEGDGDERVDYPAYGMYPATNLHKNLASKAQAARTGLQATVKHDKLETVLASTKAKHSANEAVVAAAAAAAAKQDTPAISTAAVINTKHLLPVGKEITGRGFLGTVDGSCIPTDEALAVGPHAFNHELVTVLHGVNSVVEIFNATKKGVQLANQCPGGTKIHLSKLAAITKIEGVDRLTMGEPSAWFDPKGERYVLIWTSFNKETSKETADARLFVAVSQGPDALDRWTVWALDAVPSMSAISKVFGTVGAFVPEYPQATYNDQGIFISIGACSDEDFLSTLFVFSKSALYSVPHKNSTKACEIWAATYFGATAWYRSLPSQMVDQLFTEARDNPLNNFIQPARPQTIDDLSKPPMFVMKVDEAYMSIATLTECDLDRMKSVGSAPKLVANIFSRGADFNNGGWHEGQPVMRQHGSSHTLESGDTGMQNRTYAIRSYGAVQHNGLLYLTTSEFFGAERSRLPSIYWAILDTSEDLSKVLLRDWGIISSRDGLALAYPVIGARKEGGAIVAYSYSGAGQLPHGLGPAYPGVGTTVVGLGYGEGEDESCINIVQIGHSCVVANTTNPHPWGDYSAIQFWEDRMWFAVPISGPVGLMDGEAAAWRSWIGVEEL